MKISFAETLPADGHTLAVLVGKDGVLSVGAEDVERQTGGQLSRAISSARFEGETASVVELLAPQGLAAARILVVGAGDRAKADGALFERIGGALAAKLLTSGETSVAIDLRGLDPAIGSAEAGARIAFGARLRGWRHDLHRTKLPPKQRPTLGEVIVVGAGSSAEAAHARLSAVYDGVAFARELVSEPANIIYPESFVERCRRLEALGVELTVLDTAAMQELGMGALLGVAQGSAFAPRLLAMRWRGDGATGGPLALVGKGVTFDTGGISIKPAAGMEQMKWDMGGAAAVAGAMLSLATRKAKADVIGVCALVENMPGPNAQRPGDVVTSMSGQTIEVINTDAEGRLVLCDAMTWVQKNFAPKAVIDIATLTGAMVVSLGSEHAGVFANDDGLADALLAAGRSSGDTLWRFPLGDAYDKLIESPIADMKNVGPREAGSISAAQFLQRFVQDGVRWAHLDVAGVVWANKAGSLWDKGATGYGVRLFDRYVADNWEQPKAGQ